MRKNTHSVPDGERCSSFVSCSNTLQVWRHICAQRQVCAAASSFFFCAADVVTLLPSLIVFRGPRISNGPVTRSPPPALSSSMRAESDGGIIDAPYDTGADDAAVDHVFGADKALLPYFHNADPRSSGSSEHLNSLNSMASRLLPDSRIPMVTQPTKQSPLKPKPQAPLSQPPRFHALLIRLPCAVMLLFS